MLKSHTQEALLLVRKIASTCKEVPSWAEAIKGSVRILYYAQLGGAECSNRGSECSNIRAPPLRPRDGGFEGILILLTCQPLRLTWDIITYRFARSIVTNVYKIFEYIYNFSIHVSSDVQTDCLFTSLGSRPLSNNYYDEDSLNILITCAWATRGGHAGRLNITLRTTPKANIASYRKCNLL